MNEVLNEVNTSLASLTKDYPELMIAFSGFIQAAEKPGALDRKTKQLISIALSIVAHCKWCIAFHVKEALNAGATKDEIMESSFVASLMGGGPALMYTQFVIKSLKELS